MTDRDGNEIVSEVPEGYYSKTKLSHMLHMGDSKINLVLKKANPPRVKVHGYYLVYELTDLVKSTAEAIVWRHNSQGYTDEKLDEVPEGYLSPVKFHDKYGVYFSKIYKTLREEQTPYVCVDKKRYYLDSESLAEALTDRRMKSEDAKIRPRRKFVSMFRPENAAALAQFNPSFIRWHGWLKDNIGAKIIYDERVYIITFVSDLFFIGTDPGGAERVIAIREMLRPDESWYAANVRKADAPQLYKILD